jgi:activating signal cointegrator complex subunit 2
MIQNDQNASSALLVPLDCQSRQIINKSNQTKETIPAIDRIFMIDRQFLTYQSPPISIICNQQEQQQDQGTLDQYKERLDLIAQDLVWLLKLPYQKFWCQVIYDTSCQQLIDSYLRLAPRPYDDQIFKLPGDLLHAHKSIHKYIFLTCLRMSTYKESVKDFMSPAGFATLIYQNFLFDIPKILDLCVLYRENPILEKIVQNLFSTQTRYFDDFKLCVRDIIKALESTKRKLRNIFELDSVYSLNENFANKISFLNERTRAHLKEIFEVVYYLSDLVQTLNDLVRFEARTCELLFEEKLEHNLNDMMEATVFSIEDILKEMKSQGHDDLTILIASKLKSLKHQSAKLFSNILLTCAVTPVVNSIEETGKSNQFYAEKFVRLCCEVWSTSGFFAFSRKSST